MKLTDKHRIGGIPFSFTDASVVAPISPLSIKAHAFTLLSHFDTNKHYRSLSFTRSPQAAKTAVHAIIDLLKSENRPLSKRYFESMLMQLHGLESSTVSTALKYYRLNPSLGVHCTLMPSKYGRGYRPQVYTYGRTPTKPELEELDRLFELARTVFDRNRHRNGNVAESYTQQLTFRLGEFKHINKLMLGHYMVPGSKLKLDIRAKHKFQDYEIGFSIRNWGSTLYRNAKHLLELPAYKKAFQIPMILVTTSIGAAGRKRLQELESCWIELGVQLLPKELPDGRQTQKLIEELRPLLGPAPFMFLTCDENGRNVRLSRPGEYDLLVATHMLKLKHAVDQTLNFAMLQSIV